MFENGARQLAVRLFSLLLSKRVRKKWRLNLKETRAIRENMDCGLAIFKPSTMPATEQLIGKFTVDDRSLTGHGASLFIFITGRRFSLLHTISRSPFESHCSQQDLDFRT